MSHLLDFVPASVRGLLGDAAVPLVSTQLFADHRGALAGPVLEVSWPGAAALLGVMNAARQASAALVVSFPPELMALGPESQRALVEGVLAVADAARFDKPLGIVGAVRGVAGPRAEERLYAQVDAGFTAINLDAAELGDHAAVLIAALSVPLVEAGIGVELELDGHPAPGLVLAQLDEVGLPIAAVHGVDPDDEIGDALVVVDPLEDALHEEAAVRVRLDGFLVTALTRIMSPRERRAMRADVVGFGAPCAFAERLEKFSTLDDEDRRRLETFAYAEAAEAIKRLNAEQVALDLLNALGDLGDDG